MPVQEHTAELLSAIPNLTVREGVPLSEYTRFGIGGPAEVYAETPVEASFIEALKVVRRGAAPYVVIGGGTNLIASDAGFAGAVLRFTGRAICADGTAVTVEAGCDLQKLVDTTIRLGLRGLETMTGIPGSTGAAVYGNAGAYGHSIMERVASVRFFDGEAVRALSNAECEFHYRESIFKRRKDWVIFSAELHLDRADSAELKRIADEILAVRNAKYPPTMKCAGSIFKNLIYNELPPGARQATPQKSIREGKVPSAYYLEQVGAKGLRNGDIHVADYHANLIYNAGHGTARELREVIADLKARVRAKFGFDLEEEVQYVGA